MGKLDIHRQIKTDIRQYFSEKSTQNRLTSLRHKNLKLLIENRGRLLHDIALACDITRMTQKVQLTRKKINKSDYIKLKCLIYYKVNRVEKATSGMEVDIGKPHITLGANFQSVWTLSTQ